MVIINITDINDNLPRFSHAVYSTEVAEDISLGSAVIVVSADDLDGPLNNQIRYSIESGDPQQHFSIDPESGEIRLSRHLDREELSSFTLKVRAEDNGAPPQFSIATVTVKVSDVNDNPPVFFHLNYSLLIQEGSPVGSSVLKLMVTDRDTPQNGPPFSFRITAGDSGKEFQIDSEGLLTSMAILRRRTKEEYLLQVQVTDSGYPPLSSSTFIKISIIEQSQYPPSAVPLEIFITTANEVFSGRVLGKIHATDQDLHDVLSYKLLSESPPSHSFTVSAADGKIIARDLLEPGQYTLNVSVTDGKFTTPAAVHISVWGATQHALEQGVTLKLVGMTPEEFIADHWRNLQRYLGNTLGVQRQGVHIASLQQEPYSLVLDVLLVLKQLDSPAAKAHLLTSMLPSSVQEIEELLGTQITKMKHGFCKGPSCPPAGCKSTVQMDAESISTYTTARISFITPQHVWEVVCSCNESAIRFSGNSYLQYQYLNTLKNNHLRLSLRLKTHQLQGMVMATNGTDTGALEVINGELKFEYSCGRTPPKTLGVRNVTVSDGRWHRVLLEVNGTVLRLSLNKIHSTSITLAAPCRLLQSQGSLVFGGLVQVPPADRSWQVQVQRGFRGCLDALELNGEAINSTAKAGVQMPGERKVINGELKFEYSCGRTPPKTLGVRNVTVSDGRWHRVLLEVNGTVLRLSLNKIHSTSITLAAPCRLLQSQGSLVFGGLVQVPPADRSWQVQVQRGFRGCLDALELNGEAINSTAKAGVQMPGERKVSGIYQCCSQSESCTSDPCQNGGTCQDTSTGGGLYTLAALDREQEMEYDLVVKATDGGGRSCQTDILLAIKDVNDNPPKFSSNHYVVTVFDNTTVKTPIAVVHAKDPDSDALSGQIVTTQELDYETIRQFHLKVKALDNGVPPMTSEALVIVNVSDVNDNPPEFTQPQYEATLSEMATCGQIVIKVQASDPDAVDANNLEYVIFSGNDDRLFAINKTSGIISFSNVCKRSLDPFYNLTVSVSDGVFKKSAPVNIDMMTANKHSPYFDQSIYEAELAENAEVGTQVIRLAAIDPDAGPYGSVDYTIINMLAEEKFSIDNKENKIFNFKVKARDGGSPHYNTSVPVQVQVVPSEVPLPRFSEPLYTFSAAEDLPTGSEIGSVRADANEPVIYSLVEGNTVESNKERVFALDKESGALVVQKNIDHEKTKWYQVDVMAHCNHNGTDVASLVSVSIQVQDVNDNQPVFEANPYKAFLVENMPAGTTVIQVTAIDPDTETNGEVTYRLEPETDDFSEVFTIDSESGWITSLKETDCESRGRYSFYVVASDHGGKVKLSSSALVEVTITDENDNPPQFTEDVYKGAVVENSQPDGDPLGQFSVEQVDGEWRVTLQGEIDREEKEKYLLRVTATDGRFQVTTAVEIHVLDINDNSPVCQQVLYTETVSEDAPAGFFILKVSAKDPDHGTNGQVTYTLHGPRADKFRLETQTGINSEVMYSLIDSAGDYFSVDEFSGILRLEKTLSDEPQSTFELKVKANDLGLPRYLTSVATVTVNVVDLSDYLPVFLHSEYTTAIPEGSALGAEVLSVSALTRDGAQNAVILYDIISGNEHGKFSIDSKTGLLSVNGTLDFEQCNEYYLSVEGVRGGSSSLSDITMVIINITDINDNLPRFSHAVYSTEVAEDISLGSAVIVVSADDLDGPLNNQIRYSIESGDPQQHFSIDPESGEIRLSRHLDREELSSFTLKVRAEDNGAPPQFSIATVTVKVSDVNDNPPVFFHLNYSLLIQEGSPVGSSVLRLMVTDRDTPQNGPPFSFRITAGDSGKEFQIDSEGLLTSVAILRRRTKEEYLLQVQVTDSGYPPLSSSTFIKISIIEQSQYPPSAVPLEIFITTANEVFSGRVLGKIHATDQDLHDVLSYKLLSESPPNHSFTVSAADGKIIARDLLEPGQYTLNVSVTDGKFTTPAAVHISVWGATQHALEQGVTLKLAGMTPEEFIADHWRNLQRYLGNTLGVQRQGVHIASLQQEPNSKVLDVLLVLKQLDSPAAKAHLLTSMLPSSVQEIEELLGMQITNMKHGFCKGPSCPPAGCKSTVRMDAESVSTYATARISFITPQHVWEVVCSCNESAIRFSGNSYLQYQYLNTLKNNHLRLSLRLKTHQLQGMVMATNGTDTGALELSSFTLKVRAEDNGAPPQFSIATVTVKVSDVNDNPPVFFHLNYSLLIQEGSPVGSSVLKLMVTDRDTPQNGPPFSFRITAGDSGKEFQIDSEGLLTSVAILRRRTKEEYLLQVQVTDSGYPPLSSSTFIKISIIEQSQYPPSAVPLEIFITTANEATDQDLHDVLSYKLLSESPPSHSFTVSAVDGKIIARELLEPGQYTLNVSVTDGKFTTPAAVHISVWGATQHALEQGVTLKLAGMTPEEFIADHWRNLQRYLGNTLGVQRQGVHIASLQQEPNSKVLDVLLVLKQLDSPAAKAHLLTSMLPSSVQEIEELLGMQITNMKHGFCKGPSCPPAGCKSTVRMDAESVSTYATARISFITPQHVWEVVCSCNESAIRFSGNSYLQYQYLNTLKNNHLRLSLRLKTHQLQGMVMATNGTDTGALEVINGELKFEYSCGRTPPKTLGVRNVNVSDGRWHRVLLEVNGTVLRLSLNKIHSTSITLAAPCRLLQSQGSLVFGGLIQAPPADRSWQVQVQRGFRGCLDALELNGEAINSTAKAGVQMPGERKVSGIYQCCSQSESCTSDPCRNGGTCQDTSTGVHSGQSSVQRASGRIPEDDLLDGDVGPGHEAHQADDADEEVLADDPPGQPLAVEGQDLQDGREDEIGPGHEAHQADDADEEVLANDPPGQPLAVEGQDLQDGREDESQGTAADRAHQRDDEIKLWNQDSYDT
ncbi:Protocadherin Fat 1 [Acipenser ruthenus]|uniref:Protocadherin Fat 1 n=1 Tax=Acipenser ruthenus TaxID=7906 RepID=A0A444V6X0_ACIRT|nr:Protocadherin Fat 1 [Acipenser ruthenus]